MSYHPIVQQILDLLHQHQMWYETFEHEPVTTSAEAAEVRHGYSLSQGAKALIVKVDRLQVTGDSNTFVMFVLPGDRKIENKKVKQILGVKTFSFATPEELSLVTGGVERGGVPPFGNLFHIPVYADAELFTHEKIIFNAGDRCYSIALLSSDYRTLVAPHVASFGMQM